MRFLVTISRLEKWFSRTLVVDGCWLWQGGLRDGYAVTCVNGKGQNIHRVIYQNVYGELPATIDGERLVLDHLCNNRNCLNPSHLQPVSNGDNIRRGISACKTHCVNGHEYTGENTGRNVVSGNRYCKTCYKRSHNVSQRKYMEKRRAVFSRD